MVRRTEAFRQTYETKVYLASGLGNGNYISTSVPFLDHLLQQLTLNSSFGFSVCSVGDTFIDKHHLTEDVGIVVGTALRQLTNSFSYTQRYGCSFIPLDEALARITLDFSGRSEVVWRNNLKDRTISTFSTHLVFELLNAISRTASITISAESVFGNDPHHQLETVSKSLGRAARAATKTQGTSCLSTKGML